MNEEIESIFQGKLTVDKTDIPVEFVEYIGNSEDYIVYYDDGDEPFFISDDEIAYIQHNLSFHIYTKGNYLKIVKELKKIMENHNYKWLGDDGDLYEPDTKYHHFIINFKKIKLRSENKWQE